MHENAQCPYGSASVGAFACYNIIIMVHHFARWMASPQFNHPQICDEDCKHDHDKKESILEKLLKRVGKK